jgi:hypothetical protein
MTRPAKHPLARCPVLKTFIFMDTLLGPWLTSSHYLVVPERGVRV